eukprot:superscaffoldBa00002233_g13611
MLLWSLDHFSSSPLAFGAKTSALIVCDGFIPRNKTRSLREDEEDGDQTKGGRDGTERNGGGGNEGGNKVKWKRARA